MLQISCWLYIIGNFILTIYCCKFHADYILLEISYWLYIVWNFMLTILVQISCWLYWCKFHVDYIYIDAEIMLTIYLCKFHIDYRWKFYFGNILVQIAGWLLLYRCKFRLNYIGANCTLTMIMVQISCWYCISTIVMLTIYWYKFHVDSIGTNFYMHLHQWNDCVCKQIFNKYYLIQPNKCTHSYKHSLEFLLKYVCYINFWLSASLIEQFHW